MSKRSQRTTARRGSENQTAPALYRRGQRLRGEIGAERQNRTADTVIFSHVLYQLSYLGIVPIQLYHRLIFGAGSLPCKRQAPLWSARSAG